MDETFLQNTARVSWCENQNIRTMVGRYLNQPMGLCAMVSGVARSRVSLRLHEDGLSRWLKGRGWPGVSRGLLPEVEHSTSKQALGIDWNVLVWTAWQNILS